MQCCGAGAGEAKISWWSRSRNYLIRFRLRDFGAETAFFSQYFTILDCSRCGGWQKESKLISTTTKKCCLWYSFILQFLCCKTEPEPKILQKVEPEPKLNNFGTATLHKCILLYSITLPYFKVILK